MTIDEVVAEWKQEKLDDLPSRFPCRAVMVSTISEYRELIEKLKLLPDAEMVTPEMLFEGDDLLPAYEELLAEKYKDRWLILTGVSEYLRLFAKKESELGWFRTVWHHIGLEENKGRILIPLLDCRAQWHDKDLGLCSDVRQDDYLRDCTKSEETVEKMSCLVLSKQFGKYKDAISEKGSVIIQGMRDWYEYWMEPRLEEKSLTLITGRSKMIQPSGDKITVEVVPDTLSFVRKYLKGSELLTKENCPEEAAALLLQPALQGNTLKGAILNHFNMRQFCAADILHRWEALSAGEKQLAFLWMQQDQKDDYLSWCVRQAEIPYALLSKIMYEVFNIRMSHPKWEREGQELIRALDLPREENFFSHLDAIPEYEARLGYLTGRTDKERIYLLRMVGEWMRSDPESVLECEKITEIYPELHAYLSAMPKPYFDEDLERYLQSYKSYKLANRLPQDEELYFAGFQTETYDLRYPVLAEAKTDGCFYFWIDALGAEWLSLLYWALGKCKNGKVEKITVTQSNLPSETEYNTQWTQMGLPYEKKDKLDKLAHRGVVDNKDYYACVAEQLQFVSSLAAEVDRLLKEHQRVIITGDHGTSRLAARFFHEREGYPAPAGVEVRSHGRYCILGKAQEEPMNNQVLAKDTEGHQYLLFKNYDHFKRSGFAAGGDDDHALFGELHGGAAPEEMLVPVVVMESTCEHPLRAAWKATAIKFRNKKAAPGICFNKPVQSLMVQWNGTPCETQKKNEAGTDWAILVTEKRGATPEGHLYQFTIAADGVWVDLPAIKIEPALGGGGMFDK